METKQFVYFVLACQHRNHAEAAAYLGISPSALSESISSLEKTFKLKLFRRGSFGLYPTDGARWLHQTVEPFLRRLEMAERLVGDRKLADISTLIVASPLRYLMGHISRSCSLAARSLAAAFPGVDTEIRFSAPQAADADERAAAIIGRIELDHRPGASGKSSTTVFQDRWVCITQPQGTDGPQRAMTLSLLRAGPIYVPPMPGRMFEQATDYCLKHGFPEPAVFDDDVRTFPRLLQMNSRFCLLAPESLVGESQIRLSFEHRDLPFPLHTRLTATIVEDHPAARQYVKLLKQALQTKTTLSYQPHMTLRQVKHFLTLCADLN
ncbi:MAG TPA: LysR family transcriptional regulator, partial [Terriglobales bacterium]|nr:LysR family transcriptional regulator [Terriglobales bacterium]